MEKPDVERRTALSLNAQQTCGHHLNITPAQSSFAYPDKDNILSHCLQAEKGIHDCVCRLSLISGQEVT